MEENVTQASAIPDLSGIINTLTANPALVSNILSIFKGAGDGHKPPPPHQEKDDNRCDIPVYPPKPKCKKSKETVLLEAIRPFMSPKRCETIDMIIKITTLLELIRSCS